MGFRNSALNELRLGRLVKGTENGELWNSANQGRGVKLNFKMVGSSDVKV